MSGSLTDDQLRWAQGFTGVVLVRDGQTAADRAINGAAASPAAAAPGNGPGRPPGDGPTPDADAGSPDADPSAAPPDGAGVCTTADAEPAPEQCEADPNGAELPAVSVLPDDGSSPGSPLHDAWQAGYDAAFAKPQDDHPAPAPYSNEAAAAYDAGVAAGKAAATPPSAASPASAAPPAQVEPSTPIQPTGATPMEDQAGGVVGGAPAFRFNLPPVAIAQTELVTPVLVVTVTLTLRGSLTVSFPNPPPGVSIDMTGEGLKGWRLEAGKALGPLTSGLRVNGLGTENLSIGDTLATKYAIQEVRFVPPGTITHIGQATFDYKVPSRGFGDVSVKGQAGFVLAVTVIPVVPPPQPVEEEEGEGLFDRVMDGLGTVAKGAIIVVAVAGALETDGGSLLLLKVAG